ncbi:MAG: polymer-forming cytoskeletal protein [Promethearchaeota archaeon]
MKISGSGRIQGGRIDDDIIISGSSHINGDLECNAIRILGSLRSAGVLISHGDVKSSGKFHIDGGLHGDNDINFSGSATVGNGVIAQGTLRTSGSFRANNKVIVSLGFISTGSSTIKGDLVSDKVISLDGTARIYGDIKAEDVLIDTKYQWSLKKIFSAKKHPYRIRGSIYAKNEVEISRVLVKKDIKGKNVKIGERTDILGTVYYVDNLDVHKRAFLRNKPIKIKLEEL